MPGYDTLAMGAFAGYQGLKGLGGDALADIQGSGTGAGFGYNVEDAQYGQHGSMAGSLEGLSSFAGQMGSQGNQMFSMGQGLMSGQSPYLQLARERMLQGIDDTQTTQMRNIGSALGQRGMGMGGLKSILGQGTSIKASESAAQGETALLGEGFKAGQGMFQGAGQMYGTQGQALGQMGQIGMGLTDQMNKMQMQNQKLGHEQNQYELTSAYNANVSNRENKAGFLSNVIGAGAKIGAAKIYMACIPEGTSIDTPDSFNTIEKIKVGDKVIGYSGKPVKVLQKHSYLEDENKLRFYSIKFKKDKSEYKAGLGEIAEVNCCDMHRIRGVRAKDISHADITSKEVYKGVKRSYDLLTEDEGYQIDGIPVNSMIEEMAHEVRNPSYYGDWDVTNKSISTTLTYIN